MSDTQGMDDGRKATEDDAKDDLELNDDTADQVRGGLANKDPQVKWK